ncbi:316_t:CDS:2, partial [Acaulospora colombiana]
PKFSAKNAEKCRRTLFLSKEKKTTLAYNEMVREWSIKDAQLAYLIADCCPNIEKISCSSEIANAQVYPSVINDLVIHWRNLKSLSLYHKSGTDESLTLVSISWTELVELTIANSKVTDAGICQVVKGCKRLKKIKLSNCDEITDKSLASVSEYCKNLSFLDVKSCPRFTDKGILQLANPTFAKRLRCLILENIKIKDSLLALAEHTSALEELSLRQLEDVDDRIVSAFGGSSLRLLCLYTCRLVEGWGVAELCEIKELSLMMEAISLERLREICESCKNLEKLTLDLCRIDEANSNSDIIREISKLVNLKSLAIYCDKKFSSLDIFQLKRNCKLLNQVNS